MSILTTDIAFMRQLTTTLENSDDASSSRIRHYKSLLSFATVSSIGKILSHTATRIIDLGSKEL